MKLLCVSILWTLVTAADSNHTVDATTVMTPAQNDTTTRQPEWLFMTRLVALVASAVVIRLVWSRIVSASKGSRGEEKHGKAAETEENRASSRSHAPIRETYIGLSPRSYDRTGQNPIGRNPNGRNPIGQNHVRRNPIGQNHVRQNPIGQNPNGRNPIGQNHVGQNPIGQNPIGQNPNIQNPVGQNHVGQNPVGQNPVGQNPVGQSPVGQSPIGQNPIWRNLARGCCYSDTSSIDTSRHIYDNDPV